MYYWNNRLSEENIKMFNPLYAPRKLCYKIFCRFKGHFWIKHHSLEDFVKRSQMQKKQKNKTKQKKN